MSSKTKQNLAPNILCPECSSIPLLGFNFAYDSKNISDVCELYSYCIFNHDNNNSNKKVQKIYFENIFKKNSKKSKKKNIKILCEFCKEKNIEYHCIECRRNICEECFENHKSHKYYYNKEYISEKELKDIKNKFEESQKNVKENLDLIYKRIQEYETQLEELKDLYEKYKDINDKLITFSNYFLNLYNELYQSQEDISFPIYFNLKNILLFNPLPITPFPKNLSIKSFINILNSKIISGSYFALINSNYSENLNDYNKLLQNQINYDLINLNQFNKKEVEYEKMIPFSDNKIVGIEDTNVEENTDIEIYNIKNLNIETTLNFHHPEKVFYKEQYNILIFLSKKYLYILNPKNFSLQQELSANHVIKKEKKENNYSYRYNSSLWLNEREEEEESEYECPGQFIYIEILSKDSFAVIFDGDIRRLGEEYLDLICNKNDIEVINMKYSSYIKEDYKYFSHLIIYEKEKEIFVPKKIIVLLRNIINACEVDYITGKHCEMEEVYPYCKFIFQSLIKINEDEYILVYRCKIVEKRDQYYFYITDETYKNEYIFYYINIKKDEKIEKKIYATNNKSFLLKNEKEDKYYLLCDSNEIGYDDLKNFFEIYHLKLSVIEFSSGLKVNNIFVHKNTVIGWDLKSVYLGKVYGNKFEMKDLLKMDDNKVIRFISIDYKNIFYSYSINIKNDNQQQYRRYYDRDNDDNEEESIEVNDKLNKNEISDEDDDN